MKRNTDNEFVFTHIHLALTVEHPRNDLEEVFQNLAQ